MHCRRLALALIIAGLAAPLAAAAQELAGAPAEPAGDSGPRTGWIFSVTGLAGGVWDPTTLEVGLTRAVAAQPGRTVYLAGRLGAFVSDAGFVSQGTYGLILGAVAGYRQPLLQLLEVGLSERNVSYVALTGTLELSANGDIKSPTPDVAHATAAFLFGLSYGNRAPVDEAFALLFGPLAYIGGRDTDLRLQISMRFQAPIGGRGRGR